MKSNKEKEIFIEFVGSVDKMAAVLKQERAKNLNIFRRLLKFLRG